MIVLYTSFGPVVCREARVRPTARLVKSPLPDDDDESDDERVDRRLLRSQRKAARRAQRLSIARLAGVRVRPVGDTTWDNRLGRAVVDVTRLRRGTRSKDDLWVVYVLPDERVAALVDLAKRIASSLECCVFGEPPECCALCVAVDAGRASACCQHPPRRPTVPHRGGFDVYAMACRMPACWPPCLACGAPDGHYDETNRFVVDRPTPRLVRLYSRFASSGKLPTPGLIRKRLARAAARAPLPSHDGDDADLVYADRILDAPECRQVAPDVARQLVKVVVSTRNRGRCSAVAWSDVRGNAPAPAASPRRGDEAPAPAEKPNTSRGVPEARPPATRDAALALQLRRLVLNFATLRAKLQDATAKLSGAWAHDDQATAEHILPDIAHLLAAWESAGLARCDAAYVKAKRYTS